MVEEIKRERDDLEGDGDEMDFSKSIAPRRDLLDMTKVLIDCNLASVYQTMKVAESEPQQQIWGFGDEKPLRSFLGADGALDANVDNESDEDDDDDDEDDFDDRDQTSAVDLEIINKGKLDKKA